MLLRLCAFTAALVGVARAQYPPTSCSENSYEFLSSMTERPGSCAASSCPQLSPLVGGSLSSPVAGGGNLGVLFFGDAQFNIEEYEYASPGLMRTLAFAATTALNNFFTSDQITSGVTCDPAFLSVTYVTGDTRAWSWLVYNFQFYVHGADIITSLCNDHFSALFSGEAQTDFVDIFFNSTEISLKRFDAAGSAVQKGLISTKSPSPTCSCMAGYSGPTCDLSNTELPATGSCALNSNEYAQATSTAPSYTDFNGETYPAFDFEGATYVSSALLYVAFSSPISTYATPGSMLYPLAGAVCAVLQVRNEQNLGVNGICDSSRIKVDFVSTLGAVRFLYNVSFYSPTMETRVFSDMRGFAEMFGSLDNSLVVNMYTYFAKILDSNGATVSLSDLGTATQAAKVGLSPTLQCTCTNDFTGAACDTPPAVRLPAADMGAACRSYAPALRC